MRMYLEDLSDPDTLLRNVSDVRNVQWFDDKGEPVDDETSALADRYTEYAMMCRTGDENPIPYNDWLMLREPPNQKPAPASIDPGFLKDMEAEQSLITRYNEYVDICEAGGNVPKNYEEWSLVGKKHPEHNLADEDRRHGEYLKICQSQNVDPLDYQDWLDFDKKYQEHVRVAQNPLSPATFQRFHEVDKSIPSVSELQTEVETQKALVNLLREESCNLRSEKDNLEDKIFELESSRDGLREANSALALRCQELVDSYENQKSELWKKIEDLRERVQELTSEPELVRVTKERNDLASRLDCLAANTKAAQERIKSLEHEIELYVQSELTNKQSYTDEDYESLLAIRDELVLENEALIKELSAVGQRKTPANQPLFPHYYRETPNTTHIDIYWFLKAWDVSDPCVAHAVKKLMCLGQRGVKGNLQDLEEARNSLNRAIELEQTT